MGYFIGIDLGSTTSKAIVLDEKLQIVGRGLTNTRSNYAIATKVAEQEAIINTRFTIMEGELTKVSGRPKEEVQNLVREFERLFRAENYLNNVKTLKEGIIAEISTYQEPLKRELLGFVSEIFRQIEDQAYEFYKEKGEDRSAFFRDLIGAQFMRLAEEYGESFEYLMSIFDKAILLVENNVQEIDLLGMGKKVIARMVNMGIGANMEAQLAKSLEKTSNMAFTVLNRVGTGYGRMHLPYPKEQIQSEILCHGLGAHYMFNNTRTILDIGGQDTKAIQVDENGVVSSFSMNDRCAAGCGRFLGYIADELNIGLHELGPIVLQAQKNVKISSTCTVFSTIEIRDRLSLGEKRENIVAGLHQAIVKRAMSLLARSGGIFNEFTFTGGVAKNVGVLKYLHEMVAENYGDIKVNISPDSIYTGSLGAALFAARKTEGLDKLVG
ncbi:MAG: BadF/BadG/BcrA/BcrD ATPase family protein [Thermincola sp.]|jgi:benzoyl-CoA reductase subunit A|nr:BadF/BadG/BcrA/BcrD ATPase family protein [Thermincola sp.]MDT3704997.1 BadF/BadG/BcrA/BcrD ATPase family protein [Thermincola sp.]